MAHDLALISGYLGQNIEKLRKLRGLSQQQLAKIANVPRSTVTYLESGVGNPSLQNLARIAAAFQVSIEELLSRPRAACRLVKSSEIQVKKRAQGMAQVYKLLPDSIPGMEMDRMIIDVGGRIGGVPHTENTKEYLACIHGQVQVHVAGESFELSAGDVLAFPGNQPHSYLNTGKTQADCFSVVVLAPHGV